MPATTILLLLILGLAAGYLSGIIGIGGGIIIIPVLVFVLGFDQRLAQGTTLALMVPPIGILAAWAYYKQGFVDIKTAVIICIGFIIGGYFGGKTAVNIPEDLLRKIFAVAMVLIGIKMFFSSK